MSKYAIGAVFVNNQGCKYTITAKAKKQGYWHVRFDSGFTTIAKQQNILYGKVKDYMHPSVYGVGCLGAAVHIPGRAPNNLLRRKYDLWANMLKRVYGGYNDKWSADYSDVEVTPEWLCFATFAVELEDVPNYEAWVSDSRMCLDKDLAGKRLYSKGTCTFLTPTESLSELSLRRWDKVKMATD